LIEDAKIAGPSTVLDVATGPGEPSLSIAELIGPKGRVIGIDPVSAMVEAARNEANRRRLHNASFEVAFAESLPFSANTFDTVVSRFGVMFVPSPSEAICEMLRVLKPGGRIAMAVWHFADRNPFHHVVSRVVERYVASAVPIPDAPDAFRFAEPGKLKDVLERAGVADISERLLCFPIRASLSLEEFWTLRSEMSEKLRTKLATLSQAQVAELKREVIESLRSYRSGDEVSLPAEILVVSGAKAHS
jgi:ubiquinone/menaquinone biosynthesis C-methylase UbiE